MRTTWLAAALVLAACEPADGTVPREPFEPPDGDGDPGIHEDAGVPIGDRDRDGVSDADDCAPDDRNLSLLSDGPLWLDRDGDGHTVGNGEVRCVGYEPVGVREAPSDFEDCDDQRPEVHVAVTTYDDVDGDGYGAGAPRMACLEDETKVVEQGGDCDPLSSDAWRELAYGAHDADGDGYLSEATGTVCAGWGLPYGYAETLGRDADCDDTDPAFFRIQMLYLDDDGDGYGAGPAQAVCIGGSDPEEYATDGDDCAPNDPAAWATRAYAYVDDDGDGYYVPDSGTVCVGATLPPGYQESPGPEDCDDADPARMTRITVYRDDDGDGEGAGEPLVDCGNGRPPAGTSATDLDCAPSDPAVRRALAYGFVDRDGDGQTVTEPGRVCAAMLAPPYYTTRTGNDCNDGDSALLRWEPLYPDRDGDGVGAYPHVILCIGSELPAGYSRRGDDDNDDNPNVTEDPDERPVWRTY